MNKTEQIFINQLLSGNENAYKQLYAKYFVALCYHANKILNNSFLAEEAVQTVFLKLWENRKKIKINTSLNSYLYRSVYNTSLNILKSESRIGKNQKQLTEIEEYLKVSQDDGYSIHLAVEYEERINEAIASLPPQCRQIFELSRLEGKKHKEIAIELGITQNTVQKQISIALKKMREMLRGYMLILYALIVQKK